MFGTILALFTGMFWTGQWCKDEQDEQKRRNHSRETNTSFYVDKQGRFRNTKTGKKMTSCDIKQTFFNEEEIKKKNEYYKKEYCFYCLLNLRRRHKRLLYQLHFQKRGFASRTIRFPLSEYQLLFWLLIRDFQIYQKMCKNILHLYPDFELQNINDICFPDRLLL